MKLQSTARALSGLSILAAASLASTAALEHEFPILMGPSVADRLEAAEAEFSDLEAESTAIIDSVEEGDDLSDEQVAEITEIGNKMEKVKARIAALKPLVAQGQGRRAPPEPKNENRQDPNNRRVPAEPRNQPGTGGFKNFGEFAQCVKASALKDDGATQRLLNATSTYSSEAIGADGGFAIPPDFKARIVDKVLGEEELISRCDKMETGSNSVSIPKDETTPWQTTGGVQAYWESEGSAMTASKVALEPMNARLHKLTALVPVTEELLDDAPLLAGHLMKKAPEKINYKVSNAIFDGTGVGQPLGILRSPALVVVGKEGSQAADTLLSMNVFKMWSRMYAPCRKNAIWMINQDLEPQLLGMTIPVKNVAGTENVGGGPAYIPPGGINASPFGLLLGKPVIPHEVCKTAGDVGDIVFADFSKYMAATKAGGIRTDVSIHLYFDQDVTAFKFVFRVAGEPGWSSPIARANGSNTLSAFVALEAR